MKVAVTGSLKAGENAPIIYRGNFETIFPMMREDGLERWNCIFGIPGRSTEKNWIMN